MTAKKTNQQLTYAPQEIILMKPLLERICYQKRRRKKQETHGVVLLMNEKMTSDNNNILVSPALVNFSRM